MKLFKLTVAVIVCAGLFGSCVSPEKLRKELVYFNEGLDTAKLNAYFLTEPIIQKGDLLQITISSKSSSTNQLFSQNYSSGVSGASAGSGGSGSSNAPGLQGYLVDITSGEIKLPLLGVIPADGLTKQQLEKEIIKRAATFLNEDPIVNIRYMNFSVTFLGLVGQQGRKTFESERISFLQALGEVGGVTSGGDLKHVLLMREQNGKRTLHYIDLTNGEFLNSPNYYLKQNDVIYVKPTDRKIVSEDQSLNKIFQFISFGLSIVNLIVILTTVF